VRPCGSYKLRFSDVNMNPKKRYVLQDFVQHAQKRFPREFAGVVDSSGYDFTRRTFLDANNAVREVVVLLVGHYHKRHGGPSVWARATDSSIQYFQGSPSDDAGTLIPEDQKTRVYYDAPYSNMAGSQDEKGMTVGRRAGQIVVETFITFLFLWTGYIKEVNNSERSDLLTNFEYACTKMQSVQNWPDALKLPVQQISKKRKWEMQETPSMEKTFTRIKKDIDDDDVVFTKANCTPSVTRKHSE
jgi:hypothetical protein